MSDCLPLVFLHMYKAGGTSFRRYIRAQYPDAKVKEVEGAIADLERWRQSDVSSRHEIDILMGHQYFGNHSFMRPGARYLTVLREPIDRVISFYYYVLRMPDHYLYNHGFASGMSLKEMYENTACIELDNLQVRMLNEQPQTPLPFGSITREMLDTARQNLRFISENGHVGVIELTDQLTEVLAADYGWDPSKITRSNATQGRPTAESFDSETLEIVRANNELDAELHEYARELFGKRYESLVGVRS